MYDTRQEHEDFEAGAENMEHRAMRIFSERDAELEAAFYEAEAEAHLEAALDDLGATRAQYEAARAFSLAFGGWIKPPSPVDFGSDDIPF